MSLLNFAREEVITSEPGTTVLDAAKLMKDKNIGCLVIIQDNKPVGILTDRDVMTRVVAQGGSPERMVVEEVMTPNPVTLASELGLFEALEVMKDKGVRRFPVVDVYGNLCGFFTIDDVLYLLGLEMSAVARIIDEDRI